MLVGVPKEIKDNEFRVGMTPAAVAELVHHGHQVIVERSAGTGSGLSDEEYIRAGAKIVGTGTEVFAAAEMIVKVKEPLADERKRLRGGQISRRISSRRATSSPRARPASPMRR
jgi:alanine dehydrogenase